MGPKEWNFVAKRIRENFPIGRAEDNYSEHSRIKVLTERAAVVSIALDFARNFKRENPDGFDPLVFLDQCSPDVDMYPLSELWEDD